MKNLRLISGKRIKIASVATNALADDIDELLRLCKHEGYDHDICILNPTLNFSACDEDLEYLKSSASQMARILDSQRRHGITSKRVARGSQRFVAEGTYPQSTCILGFAQVLIRANGDLRVGCHDLDPVGNVLKRRVAEILASERAIETARKMFRLNYTKCICNWQIDETYSHPIRNVGYLRKRLATLKVSRPTA